jgi:hypothetical protein
MAFTTEHYEGVARVLGVYIAQYCRNEDDVRSIRGVAEEFAIYFDADNNLFEKERFIGYIAFILDDELREVFLTTEV